MGKDLLRTDCNIRFEKEFFGIEELWSITRANKARVVLGLRPDLNKSAPQKWSLEVN